MSFTSSTSISVRDRVVTMLVSAYFEIITESVDLTVARELSISVAMLADVDRLLALGRAVRDPFPWVPFLRHLHGIPQHRRTARSDEARLRLHATATTMLAHQRLGPVRPEDLLARPTPFEEALASLAPNTI